MDNGVEGDRLVVGIPHGELDTADACAASEKSSVGVLRSTFGYRRFHANGFVGSKKTSSRNVVESIKSKNAVVLRIGDLKPIKIKLRTSRIRYSSSLESKD